MTRCIVMATKERQFSHSGDAKRVVKVQCGKTRVGIGHSAVFHHPDFVLRQGHAGGGQLDRRLDGPMEMGGFLRLDLKLPSRKPFGVDLHARKAARLT
jgi:hypothetical protein